MHEQRSLSIERQICCQLVHKEDHLLCDVLGGGANSADSKENIVTEEVASQHLDLFGESSRKHHSLPSILRSKMNRHSKGLPLSKLQSCCSPGHVVLLNNSADLGLEAHVQHSVRFVQAKIPEIRKE